MYCKNCGTDLPDDALFCSECGAAVNSEQKETAVRSVPEMKSTSADRNDKIDGKLILGVTVFLTLLLVIVKIAL